MAKKPEELRTGLPFRAILSLQAISGRLGVVRALPIARIELMRQPVQGLEVFVHKLLDPGILTD